MKILLIDAGNTTIDFRSYDPETKQLEKIYRPLTKTLANWNQKEIQKNIKWEHFNFEMVVFASVVPKFNEWIQKFGKTNEIPILNIKESKKIKTNGFKNFDLKEIGADFIANFHAQNWNDALIISLGTATTITQIQEGLFQGVVIIPGIRTSLDSLINSAALLKAENFNWTTQKIGTSTISAISLGTINGHYYLIKSFINQLKTKNTQIVFTGGNADLIISGIKEDNFLYNEELIFQGLIKCSVSSQIINSSFVLIA